jgi:hypothetical protein
MILEALLAKELEPETPREIATLMTWARQHISEQAEHIDAIEDELEKEIEVRFKLQHAVEHAREVTAQQLNLINFCKKLVKHPDCRDPDHPGCDRCERYVEEQQKIDQAKVEKNT